MAILLASLLDADWSKLGEEAFAAAQAGVDGISIDIMDGEFVPRITFGPVQASIIRNLVDLPIEVHLMTAKPENHVETFCDAGADQVIFHLEATDNPMSLIKYIKGRGLRAGISVLKETSLSAISNELLETVDTINLMSIKVGYGGQVADDCTLERLRCLRERAKAINPLLALEVDGGMKHSNCARFVNAGADVIIVGTGIFKSNNYQEAVSLIKSNLTENEEDSKSRLETFFAQPSRIGINDTKRRQRLNQLRINLDIPESSWNPLTSKR